MAGDPTVRNSFTKSVQDYEFLDRAPTPARSSARSPARPSPPSSPGDTVPKYGIVTRERPPYSPSSSSSGGYPSPHPSLMGSSRGSSRSGSPPGGPTRAGSPARSGSGSPARGSSQRVLPSPARPNTPFSKTEWYRRACKRDSAGLCTPTQLPRTASQAGGRSAAKWPSLGGIAAGGRAGGGSSGGKWVFTVRFLILLVPTIS